MKNVIASFTVLAALLPVPCFSHAARAAVPSFVVCETSEDRSSLPDIRLQLMAGKEPGIARDIKQTIQFGHNSSYFAAVHGEGNSHLVVYALSDLSLLLDTPLSQVAPLAAILGPAGHAKIIIHGQTLFIDGMSRSSTDIVLDRVDLKTGKETLIPLKQNFPPVTSVSLANDRDLILNFGGAALYRFDTTTMSFKEEFTIGETPCFWHTFYVPGSGLFTWTRDAWSYGTQWGITNELAHPTDADLTLLHPIPTDNHTTRVIAIGGTARTGPFALLDQTPETHDTLFDTRWRFHEHLAITKLDSFPLPPSKPIASDPVQAATIQDGPESLILFLNQQGTEVVQYDPAENGAIRGHFPIPAVPPTMHPLLILSSNPPSQ